MAKLGGWEGGVFSHCCKFACVCVHLGDSSQGDGRKANWCRWTAWLQTLVASSVILQTSLVRWEGTLKAFSTQIYKLYTCNKTCLTEDLKGIKHRCPFTRAYTVHKMGEIQERKHHFLQYSFSNLPVILLNTQALRANTDLCCFFWMLV